MKYSIWAVPPEPVFTQLKTIIDDLATRYRSVAFTPHMTVLGGFEFDLPDLSKKIESIAENYKPLKLSLGPVSFSTTYYQSVLVRVNSTSQIMQLNLDIKKVLGFENDLFMPHISLLYGDHDMRTREKIVVELKIDSTEFIVNELTIVPGTLNPDEWKNLNTIPFGKKA